MATPPVCHKGDWFRGRGWGSRVQLKSYFTAPSQCGCLPAWPREPIAKDAYLGPVHEVDTTHDYIAILVPHPSHQDTLVWINVWCSHGRTISDPATHFAEIVPAVVLDSWQQSGWENRFLPH